MLQGVQETTGTDLQERRKAPSYHNGRAKELFEKYMECVRKYQTITDCLLFWSSFKLDTRMMVEVMKD